MFENLKADIAHARRVNAPAGWWNQHVRVLLNFGFLAVASYRLSRWTRSVRIPVLRQVLVILSEILRRLTQIVTGVDKSGFESVSKPIQDKLAKELGPHAVKILELVRNVK